MFGTKLGLHIIQFPSGRWGYVGAVPTALCEAVPANKAAILGCRAWRGEDGHVYEWKDPTFDSREAAETFAKDRGFSPR